MRRWSASSLAGAAAKKAIDSYCAYAGVESVQTAIERLRSKNTKKVVKLPRLSAYSFRHKVATVLRKARQSEDVIGMQLGHRREGARTTAGYGEWDPAYLKGVADALGTWFVQLGKKVKNKTLLPVPATECAFSNEQRQA